MSIDPRSLNFTHAPWCLSAENAVAGEADNIRRWFLHECACPTVQILSAAALISHTKCGYSAFAATDGSARKIFSVKESRQDISAYEIACAGMKDMDVIMRSIPAQVSGTRYTKTLTPIADGPYLAYSCTETSESISEFPETDDCAIPEDVVETDDFVTAYTFKQDCAGCPIYDCAAVFGEREISRVTAGSGTATPSVVYETPPDPTETERINSRARTTFANSAVYSETISTPVYTTGPCGEYLSGMDGETTTHTVPGRETVRVATNHDVLSDAVASATVTAMSFWRNGTWYETTAYGPVQTDGGLALEQQVSVAVVLKNLLIGVRYTARLRTARRTRALNAAGTGFDVGPWELYADDAWDFTADATQMLLGGSWLGEDAFDAAAVQVENLIPADAPNFRSVAEAEDENASANVRAEYTLGDGAPGFEYRVWEALCYPKIGVHEHREEAA